MNAKTDVTFSGVLVRIFPALGDTHHKLAHGAKSASTTKSGPGRYAVQSEPKDKPVKPNAGQFAGTRTNPAKNKARAAKARIGARQYRKQLKALRTSGVAA